MAPKSQEYLKIRLLFTQRRYAVALKLVVEQAARTPAAAGRQQKRDRLVMGYEYVLGCSRHPLMGALPGEPGPA